MARQHNNANVLSIGARIVAPELAEEITRIFLDTQFEGGRHQRRIDEIAKIEIQELLGLSANPTIGNGVADDEPPRSPTSSGASSSARTPRSS